MGDMANFYINQHMNAHPNDFWMKRSSNARPTCTHCGMRGLKWKSTDKGWRLADANTNIIHTCPQYKRK